MSGGNQQRGPDWRMFSNHYHGPALVGEPQKWQIETAELLRAVDSGHLPTTWDPQKSFVQRHPPSRWNCRLGAVGFPHPGRTYQLTQNFLSKLPTTLLNVRLFL